MSTKEYIICGVIVVVGVVVGLAIYAVSGIKKKVEA